MEKSTGDLMKTLQDGHGSDVIEDYLENEREEMADTEDGRSFYRYMKGRIKAHKRSQMEGFLSVGLDLKYGGELLRQEKHTSNRDMILLLCLAFHLNVLETNRALRLYGFSELYPRIKRDAVLITLINQEVWDVETIQERLSHYECPGLEVSWLTKGE